MLSGLDSRVQGGRIPIHIRGSRASDHQAMLVLPRQKQERGTSGRGYSHIDHKALQRSRRRTPNRARNHSWRAELDAHNLVSRAGSHTSLRGSAKTEVARFPFFQTYEEHLLTLMALAQYLASKRFLYIIQTIMQKKYLLPKAKIVESRRIELRTSRTR